MSFQQVLRDTISAIRKGGEYDDYFIQLSELIKQGARGSLYQILQQFHPSFRKLSPYMHSLEELLYFLLSEGVEPDIEDIMMCCVKGSPRLLEDLLKYYNGPDHIEYVHYDSPPLGIMCDLVEVFYGFSIKFRIRRFFCQKAYDLSMLENCFVCYGKYSESFLQQLIEQTSKFCPPPDMDIVTDFAAVSGLDMGKVQEAYEFYLSVKAI